MREEGATNDGRIKQIRDCIELSLPKIQKLLPFLNSKRWCWGGGGGGGERLHFIQLSQLGSCGFITDTAHYEYHYWELCILLLHCMKRERACICTVWVEGDKLTDKSR